MRKDNKVNLKGAKNLENKKFNGNVASIVKKITAAAIGLGLAVTASQAVKMYKEWETNRNLDTLNSILNLDENNINNSISIDENVLEEFELILQEYRQALEDNDENRKAELDNQVMEKDYYRLIAKELENSIIRNLGYNTEEVKILFDRSGLLYLIDKEEIEKGVSYTTIGTLSDKVKIKDKNGNFVKIHSSQLYGAMTAIASGDHYGVMRTADLYEALRDELNQSKENDDEIDINVDDYEMEI